MSMRQKHSRMKIDVSELADRKVDDDFKKLCLKTLGDLSGIEVLGGDVLVASYIAPRITAGGIILADNTLDEDRWQGKVGLLLKMGPLAFKFHGSYAWEGVMPKIGDYVTFNSADGFNEIGIRGQSCRLIPFQLLGMRITDPKIIY